jgi:hypothetical protein
MPADTRADRGRPTINPPGGRAGTRGDERPPVVTPRQERLRLPPPSGPTDTDHADRSRNVREPFDGRAGTRGDGRSPVVIPSDNRGRSPGHASSVDEPRSTRTGVHEPTDGARGDGRSPAVRPEPDRPREPSPFSRPNGASSPQVPPAIRRFPDGWDRTDRNAEAPRGPVLSPPREAPPSIEHRRLDADVVPRARIDSEARPPSLPRAPEHGAGASIGSGRDAGSSRSSDAARTPPARDSRSSASDSRDRSESSRGDTKKKKD